MDEQQNVVFYDGDCSLCKRFKLSLQKVTSEIVFVNIHDQESMMHYPQVELEKARESLHLIDESSNIYVGEKAFARIVTLVPAAKSFLWLLESGMGERALSFFYKSSDKLRQSLLNRCSSCKKTGGF